VNCTTLFTLW